MKMNLGLLAFVLCAFDCALGSSPYSPTAEDLAYYYRAEETTINIIQNLITNVEEQLEILEKHASGHTHQEDLDSLISLLSHPIDGYNILKETIERWAPIKTTVELLQQIMKDSIADVELYRNEKGFPEEEDLKAFTQGILKSQHMYNQDVHQFVEGNVTHFQDERVFATSFVLSPSDCLVFAQAAYDAANYEKAIEFCKEGLRKLGYVDDVEDDKNGDEDDDDENDDDNEEDDDENEEDDDVDLKEEIKELLQSALSEKEAIPEHGTMDSDDDYDDWEDRKKEPKIPEVADETIGQMCRGEMIKTLRTSNQLSCRYFRNNNPYLLLGPMKIEYSSLDPLVVLIHDVIYDKEIEVVMDYYSSKLAGLYNGTEEELEENTKKPNRKVFLASSKLMEKTTRRIQAFTGFNINTFKGAEPYQISSYGVEGDVPLHYDFLQNKPSFKRQIESKFRGDRMATLLTYLSDVEAGGATIFPKAKVTIFPRKGSAALWFNLKRNGIADLKSLHAECPILHGVKHVMTKWIGYYDQMFSAPCSLNPKESFKANYWR